jgi:hypothetical protein
VVGVAIRDDERIVSALPPPLPAGVAAPQLSPENLHQLHLARTAMRKVRRAAAVATIDGWTIGTFGVLTALVGLFDVTGVVMGLGMVAIACVELRGAARLRRLEAPAAAALGWNQIALGTLLLAYAVWRLTVVMRGGGEYAAIAASDPQIGRMLEPFEGLTRLVLQTVYGTLIAVAVFGQGSMALYYFTRRAHVRSYLSQTPPWIIEMQRAGVSL